MDSASSIERRIAAMKQVYEAGIRTVCFVSPVFPGITDFEAIFERVKDQCDLFWLENLNLRGGFKKTIMDYIAEKYPDLVPLYDEIQTNGLCAGIDALEVEDVLDGGTAEPVDALVIVADDADVLFRPGEQADQAELCHAGVLVFVHEQIAVFVLVELPHLLVPGQQLDGLVDEVIEIERTGVLQLLFVGRIDLGRQRPFRIPRRGAQSLFGADELVFPYTLY